MGFSIPFFGSMGLTALIFLGALMTAFIGGAILILITLNQKYPKVSFEVWEQGYKTRETYRLYGNKKIVDDDLLQILFRGDELIGEGNIEDFDMIRIDGGLLSSSGKLYVAQRKNDQLAPMDVSDVGDIRTKEISNAKSLARNYVSTIEEVKGQVESQKPIKQILVTMAPYLFIMLTVVGMVGVMIWAALEPIQEITKDLKTITEAWKGKVDVNASANSAGSSGSEEDGGLIPGLFIHFNTGG